MKKNKPEWTPDGADEKLFASYVMPGIKHEDKDAIGDIALSKRALPKRKNLSFEEYREGVLKGDKTILARAITMVESNAEAHFDMAQKLLNEILPHAGKSFRIGITGVPGAGKSSFIETFGSVLCKNFGKKVAVLAVDPSSSVTGGSILGDKTRMENLSREENAFIRPSPSGGMLGGIARKTRETMLLCEAAGYDVILIETVGVGQSEVSVRSMTDFFLLIQLASQGDDLQGIKKGVMELADGILVNKCDGILVEKSMMKCAELEGVLHILNSPTPGWHPFCDVCSAMTGMGIDRAWERLENFRQTLQESGYFWERRKLQEKQWFKSLLETEVLREFYSSQKISDAIASYEKLIMENSMSVAGAVKKVIEMK